MNSELELLSRIYGKLWINNEGNIERRFALHEFVINAKNLREKANLFCLSQSDLIEKYEIQPLINRNASLKLITKNKIEAIPFASGIFYLTLITDDKLFIEKTHIFAYKYSWEKGIYFQRSEF